MKLRSFAAASVLLFGHLASGSAPSDPTYPSLPAHKALAISVDEASVMGIASGQASDQMASVSALQSCERARAARQSGVCEVTHLNESAITTGREIHARVPRSAHPLFLWRFDAKGSTVYLAGSIHVMKASLFPLPSQFEDAFRKATQITVEVNTDAVAPALLGEKFREYALLPSGQSLGAVLTPSTLTLLSTYLQTQSSTLSSIASLKPAMVATQLAVARLSALGYLPEFGLEQHFIGAAAGRPILELETIDQQLAVLTSPPMQVQDEMLADTIDQMDTIEPIISAMIVAWLAGDEHEFRRLFDLQSGDSREVQAFMRRLLEDRNVGMAEKIFSYLRIPGATFVLVGAAHLTGPEGIVALLEARGVHGRRINSNDKI